MTVQDKIKSLATEIGAGITEFEDAVHSFLSHILHLKNNDQAKAQSALENAIVKAQDAVDTVAEKAKADVQP